MRVEECQKYRVLVASNGSPEVAQADQLVRRLCQNPIIETRAIFDGDESCPTSKSPQNTLVLKNAYFKGSSASGSGGDGSGGNEAPSQVEQWKLQAYELCKWADIMVVAPIDADTFAKMLCGISECLLLEVLRTWDITKTILLVPGMSTLMWENPMTKSQIDRLRRKWPWVQIMRPILWRYNGSQTTKHLLVWDGLPKLVHIIENEAESLNIISSDVNAVAAKKRSMAAGKCPKSQVVLPREIWSLIFERVGDWEISRALNIYANLPVPPEWQYRDLSDDPLEVYMRELEWVILTSPTTQKMIDKLNDAPRNLPSLSNISVNLVIKFCLLDLLTFLESNRNEVFWASFGQMTLPNRASAIYGQTKVLDWWSASPSFATKDYTADALDGASKMGFLSVLDWWRHSGLAMKYTEAAMEQASSKGQILVLEWWKQSSIYQGTLPLELQTPTRKFTDEDDSDGSPDARQPLPLLPGKSLLTAAQNNQTSALRWWYHSCIPIEHAEAVAKVASQHGHVEALDTWLELNGETMTYDNKILVDPTKNGHINVLQWWKDFSRGSPGSSGRKVEYKTCDIEEALEDCIRSESITHEVRDWWARNGLNLELQVREWTRVRVL